MTVSSLATTTTATQVDKTVRMGRRKQNCPQKTGLTSNNDAGEDEHDENGQDVGEDEDRPQSDSASVKSDKEVTMPTLESLEPDENRAKHTLQGLPQTSEESDSLKALSANPFLKLANPAMLTSQSSEDSLGLLKTLPLLAKSAQASPVTSTSSDLDTMNMIKNSQLFNPALLALNPSLYAMHLAQLQAAQLLSQTGLQQLAGTNLDESRKRKLSSSGEDALPSGNGVLNLSKKSPETSPARERGSAESPLDLSGSKKQFGSLLDGSPAAKIPKFDDSAKFPFPWAAAGLPPFLGPLLGNLTPEALARIPGLGSLVSGSSSFPTTVSPPPLMSSPSLLRPGEAKNPLERMSEIAKTGGATSNRPSLGGRHSAWQSQWINRGPESNKEVFKCVWCKESFTSLNALTIHMKETKHFGGAIPPTSPIPQQIRPPTVSPQKSPPSSIAAPSMHQGSSSGSQKTNRDILKEQLPLPRKLVRGQDVWLGKGEQQTKDILKCMWCGESFRSLDIMTKHMQETKHYTKVISQEQLMSWKATDAPGGGQNHVNAVLTCKVCDQGFSSLKDLSDHMVKNNHFNKESGGPGRPPGAPQPGASPTPTSAMGAVAALAGQNKEKRKKSLPVRKLLELERAQQELSGHFKSDSSGDDQPGKIACERCGDKIPMLLFVDHIRQCVGPGLSPARSMPGGSSRPPSTSAADFAAMNRILGGSAVSPPATTKGATTPTLGAMFGKKTPPPVSESTTSGEEPKSILGSLERMVQNNFGSKRKNSGPEANLSILQRLGIDEGVDYTKPLMDPTSALFRAQGMASFFNTPNRPSASSHSNSSACSSPDRFKSERSVSVKSESSAVSPIPADDTSTLKVKLSSPAALKPESDDEAVEQKSDLDEKNDIEPEAIKEEISKEDKKEGSLSPKPPSEPVSPPSSNNQHPRRSITPESRHSEGENGNVKQEILNDDENCKSGDKVKEEETDKSTKSHPLAALQMLCEKTEKKSTATGSKSANHGSGLATSVYGGPSVDPGAILAFSWACNQAVVNDSLLKCPFCDTPFISKGAYRHHLSKMHFVKDGAGTELASKSFIKTPEKSPASSTGENSGGSSIKEENAQSKFQKYSQLAKQLSCSGQP